MAKIASFAAPPAFSWGKFGDASSILAEAPFSTISVPPPKSTATPPETPFAYWPNLKDSHYSRTEATPVNTGVTVKIGTIGVRQSLQNGL